MYNSSTYIYIKLIYLDIYLKNCDLFIISVINQNLKI